MAMDGDVFAQFFELVRQKQSLRGAKSTIHVPPRFALRAKSLQLRTPMTVSDVENGARNCGLPPNSATTRLGRKNIPVDKDAKRK